MVEANFADYEYAVDSITSYDGRDVYVITFDQKATLKANLWKGKIFIEADSKAILEIVSALSPRGEEYRKHLSGKDKIVAGLLGIDFKLLNKKTRYSYHKTGDKWSLHDATLQLDIDFKQPRKQIDERINLTAELLSISQDAKNTTPITRGEQWQKNQLVLNLPGEFDEGFWGADNFIKPETSLTSVVASMKTINEKTLSTGLTTEWQFFQQNLAKAYSKDSTVILKPYVESRWKDNQRAPLLWKWQEGDFDFSAKVKVAKATDEGSPPDKGFQVGGLMLRNADSELENYILLGLGCMGNEKMKIISQTNIHGNSAFT